ncbi:c-type cytochrome [Robiginitomaculum antarcticum]|uniref:c-type cytochrome n=1 Tax=Robiginitomaculum antarcticum TaxID=437507 RepID=UPI00036D7CA8|nr:cytochrome c family protein [Robiginitomaculum antarcticum]
MMEDLRFNKIAGAILATGLVFIGVVKIGEAVYADEAGDEVAYGSAILEEYYGKQNAANEPEIELPFPQAEWVSAMDATRGEAVFKKCASCHSVEKGGATKTGPNLWNIVGTNAAQKDGFSYSAAMAESSITWNYESLNDYLEKPSRYVKGTAMSFGGLKKPEDRAAIIEFLRVNADSPLNRPAPAVVIEEAPVVETDPVESGAVIVEDDPSIGMDLPEDVVKTPTDD